MGKTYAVKGDWNCVCDVCGFKYKASQLKDRWDGLKVCKDDWEARHPSDYYKFPTGTESTVPWTTPEPIDIDIINHTTSGRSGIAGYAIAGSAIAGLYLDIPPSLF